MTENSRYELLEELSHPALGLAIFDSEKNQLYLPSSMVSDEELETYRQARPGAKVRAADSDGLRFLRADDLCKIASDPILVIEKEMAWRMALYKGALH